MRSALRSWGPRQAGWTAALEERIGELEATVWRLNEMSRMLLEQRDAWRQRALEAEALHAKRSAKDGRRKFKALKYLIAAELHPDAGQGDRLLNQETFKRIWNKVEELEKAG